MISMAEKESKTGVKAGENPAGGEKKGKNGNGAEIIAKVVEQKLAKAGVDFEEVEQLTIMAEELKQINEQVQALISRRQELRDKCYTILEKIPKEVRKLLEALELVDFKEIVNAMHSGTERKRSSGTRAGKGNGLSSKVIIFEDTEYRNPHYFMKKHGITGGLQGLKEWAESQGLNVRVEDDTIYIE